jgi:class 3 adenylate cyclase
MSFKSPQKMKILCTRSLFIYGNRRHAERVVKAAMEISEFIESYQQKEGEFNIRIGIHSGPVVAGIVGTTKFQFDIWGDTVNLAASMEQTSEPGRINISIATYELVKDHFYCAYRGKIKAKNKGEVDMSFVEPVKETVVAEG